jgi:hypothetical protein
VRHTSRFTWLIRVDRGMADPAIAEMAIDLEIDATT